MSGNFKNRAEQPEAAADDVNNVAAEICIPTKRKQRSSTVVGNQIKEARLGVQEKINRIIDVIAVDGKLAPQIPFIVPQPFDKYPYVSMNDGRTIAFYTHMDSIIKFRTDEEPNPVHRYHMKYWPHTENATTPDNSQGLHDPHLNNFELVHNYRKVLHCEMCSRRLRIRHRHQQNRRSFPPTSRISPKK